MDMKFKRKFAAIICLLTAAAAVGMTSCTDVDLEQFYLESLPDSTAQTEQQELDSGAEAETTAEKDTGDDTSESDGGLKADELSAVDTDDTPAADTDPAEQVIPDEVFELSEAEQSVGEGISAQTLSGSEDSEAPDEQTEGTGVSAAYSKVLSEYSDKCVKDPLLKPDFCRYYIADIDGDGTPELLAETGSCEADRTVFVYAFDPASGIAKSLGSFVAWHAELGMSGGRLGCETRAMGSYLLTVVDISGGSVSAERDGAPTEDSALDEVLEYYSFTDLTGVAGV